MEPGIATEVAKGVSTYAQFDTPSLVIIGCLLSILTTFLYRLTNSIDTMSKALGESRAEWSEQLLQMTKNTNEAITKMVITLERFEGKLELMTTHIVHAVEANSDHAGKQDTNPKPRRGV